jgi:hypothetical protein
MLRAIQTGYWDAGLRDEDVVALIACTKGASGPQPAAGAVYLSVLALRKSAGQSKLGPPKSASEGAERDRTWPAVIPRRPGKVLSVNSKKIVVMMENDGEPSRKQTYTLNGKYAYVASGDRFAANVTILAGAPRSLADLTPYRGKAYYPLDHLSSARPIDRYAAVKALRFRTDLQRQGVPALEKILDAEQEIRVALEAAASAAALHSAKGEERVAAVLWGDTSTEMSMEAILILTELKTTFAREQLRRAAIDKRFSHDERRQAAIWGLGKAGLKSYDDLVPFIGDAEPNAAYHAIAAFGPDTPQVTIKKLVKVLVEGDPRNSSAASEALRVIGTPTVLECLIEAVQGQAGNTDWAIATIGRLSADIVRTRLKGTPLLERLEPTLLLAPGANWLANEEALTDMAFLLKQTL